MIDFRTCKWEDCIKNPHSKYTRYCREHRLVSHLKNRIKSSEEGKRLDREIKEMKRETYVKLYRELQEKVIKELDEHEKRVQE